MNDQERIAKLERLLKAALNNYNEQDHVEQMYHDWAHEAEHFLKPPPGLLECRAICNAFFNGNITPQGLDYSTGKGDNSLKMKAVLAAYSAGLNAKDLIAKSIDGRVWYKVNV